MTGSQSPEPERVGKSAQVLALAFAAFMIGAWLLLSRGHEPVLEDVEHVAHLSVRSPDNEISNTKFAVTINKPAGAPRVSTGQTDPTGSEITVACSTCHSIRPPNLTNRKPEDLNEFHGGLKFAHGDISCLSCHNPNDYDTLKLADGATVEFTDVMTLCAQCHGPQTRDFKNGAHGGMTGFWDLSRGPRSRNNCVDCHDPHAPQFPQMKPTFKPRDRFLDSGMESKKEIHHD